MLTIERSFFEETLLHTLTAEVSELQHGNQLPNRFGLPKRFMIPGAGNGNAFVVNKIERDDEDNLQFVEYRQTLGCLKAIIFND